jgi:hypothetical protein
MCSGGGGFNAGLYALARSGVSPGFGLLDAPAGFGLLFDKLKDENALVFDKLISARPVAMRSVRTVGGPVTLTPP